MVYPPVSQYTDWASVLRKVWQASYEGGFRWLGWIAGPEDAPTSLLARAVNPETRKGALRETLETQYATVIPIAQQSETSRHDLEIAFERAFGARGQTQYKAVTFFIYAAEYVGLPIAPQLLRIAATAPDMDSNKDSGKTDTETAIQQSVTPTSEPAQERSKMVQPQSSPDNLANPRTEFLSIVAVLANRIPPSRKWTSDERDRFVQAVAANLNALIDVEERQRVAMNGVQYEHPPVGNTEGVGL